MHGDGKLFHEFNAGVEEFFVRYVIAPELAPRALKGVSVDILNANT